MEVSRAAEAARQGAGLFPLQRGLIEVTGRDRVRWLNGMISADVAVLDSANGDGCYALLLTPKGSIVADLHVLAREASVWLELDAVAAPTVLDRLDRYVIADDVTLSARSHDFERFALEGRRAHEVLAGAAEGELPTRLDSYTTLRLAGVPVLACAFGFSALPAFQLFVPAGEGGEVTRALRTGSDLLVVAPEAALEVLRVESGMPRLGAELDEEVLPAEAGLTERAVSFTKGCYTGQEIVARLDARGRVNHLLVGLHFEGDAPSVGSPLSVGGRDVGEVTSVAESVRAGRIGLGFVRREHAIPGARVGVAGGSALIAELPFVKPDAA
jgi:folate-binding protein YgfZ